MNLHLQDTSWTLDPPFVIARERRDTLRVLVVTLEDGPHTGRAEVVGVPYHGETPEVLRAQIQAVEPQLKKGISRDALYDLLPPGGARNGLDLALWDLEAQRTGQPVHTLAGLPVPRPTRTTYTIGIMSLDATRERVLAAADYSLLKIKVSATHHIDALRTVRDARPEADIIVDANQGWDWTLFEQLEPALLDLGIEMLEQPFAVGADDQLADYDGPICVMADESCQDRRDLDHVSRLYGAINIKLDKTGGLTEAIKLAQAGRDAGLKLMVGNMCGGSLAMAPAYLVAQLCDYADLDGPLLQTGDWPHPLRYHQGEVLAPTGPLWGGLGGYF